MATTTNLEAEKWTANQSQPEVTVNETFDVFDAAITGTLTHNMSSDANYSLIITGDKPQEWMYDKIRITDSAAHLTTQRSIFVPTNEKHYVAQNNAAQPLLFETSAGNGVIVEPGRTVRLRCDGTDVVSDESYLHAGSEFRGYTETVVQASTTGAVSLSCASANVFDLTLVGNTTLSFTDVPSTSGTMFTATIFVTQDGGGANSFAVSAPTSVIYASGEASTTSQAGGDRDIWIFATKDGGSTWYGMAGGLQFR